jgi:CTP synthase (UTP-ammonia lyase)
VPEPGAPRIKGKKRVVLTPGSLVARAYGETDAYEQFFCSNELNRLFQPLFEESDLRVTGVGDEGEARVVELAGAAFFAGTLYLPQSRALDGESHPLVEAFLAAAAR